MSTGAVAAKANLQKSINNAVEGHAGNYINRVTSVVEKVVSGGCSHMTPVQESKPMYATMFGPFLVQDQWVKPEE